jgi:hypothetical protein
MSIGNSKEVNINLAQFCARIETSGWLKIAKRFVKVEAFLHYSDEGRRVYRVRRDVLAPRDVRSKLSRNGSSLRRPLSARSCPPATRHHDTVGKGHSHWPKCMKKRPWNDLTCLGRCDTNMIDFVCVTCPMAMVKRLFTIMDGIVDVFIKFYLISYECF